MPTKRPASAGDKKCSNDPSPVGLKGASQIHLVVELFCLRPSAAHAPEVF